MHSYKSIHIKSDTDRLTLIHTQAHTHWYKYKYTHTHRLTTQSTARERAIVMKMIDSEDDADGPSMMRDGLS